MTLKALEDSIPTVAIFPAGEVSSYDFKASKLQTRNGILL